MKRIRLTPLFFRRIHKWVGLILGLQFLLWALSGSVMALLDKDKVGGHGGGANAVAVRLAEGLGATPVVTTATDSVRLPALDTLGYPYEEETMNPAARLFLA